MVKEKQGLTRFLIIVAVIVISLVLVYYVVNYFSTGFRTSGQGANTLHFPELFQDLHPPDTGLAELEGLVIIARSDKK